MDVNGARDREGAGARKRRAMGADAAPLPSHLPLQSRKKPRRRGDTETARHGSEFVDVKVGMREFRKRMAASGADTKQTQPDAEAAPTTSGHGVGDMKPAAAETVKPRRGRQPADKPARQPRAATKKPTLAEVKAQLQREQQERIEVRVQQLHSVQERVPTAGETTTKTVEEPRREHESTEAAELPIAANRPVEDTLQLPTDPASSAPVVSASQTIAPTVPAAANEFIGDDEDEDMAFLLALEQVEMNLSTPTKPAALQSSHQAPPSSALISDVAPVVSAQDVNNGKPDPSEASPQGKTASVLSEKSPNINGDEVLREFERLKRENEELRRSNERLQAAVATQVSPVAVVDTSSIPSGVTTAEQPLVNEESPRSRRVLNLSGCSSAAAVDSSLPVRLADPEHVDEAQVEEPASRDPVSVGDRSSAHADEIHPTSILDLSAEVSVDAAGPDDLNKESAEREDNHGSQCSADVAGPDDLNKAGSVHEDNHGSQRDDVDATRNNDDETVQPIDDQDGDRSDTEEQGDEETEQDGGRAVTVDTGNYREYKHQVDGDEESNEDKKTLEMPTTADGEPGEVSSLSKTEGNEQHESPGALASSVSSASVADLCQLNEPSATIPKDSAISESADADKDVKENEGEFIKAEGISAVVSSEPSPMVNEEDGEFTSAKRTTRAAIIESSSSSETDSDDGENASDSDDTEESGTKNALEAALKAAASTSSKRESKPQVPPARSSAPVSKQTAASVPKATNETTAQANGQKRSAPSASVASQPGQPGSGSLRKRARSAVGGAPSIRSTLLWPALDDFYDFLLDLSPVRAGRGGEELPSLRQFPGRKLPAQYASVEQYSTTQLEAIKAELIASLNNASRSGGGGGHHGGRSYYLTSISPCSHQQSGGATVSPLNSSVIFSESGFSGSSSNKNDYILTLRPSGGSRRGGNSGDLISGDLIVVRSPRWKNYELLAYGVVLCNSVFGESGNGNSASDSDQICVLLRAREDESDDAANGSFSVITELCLSNQRSPKWNWSIQQVHNTTTSAREYQAMRSMTFFSADLRQALLNGKVLASGSTKQESTSAPADNGMSPELRLRLEKHYNASQIDAIVGCLGQDKTVIIQGPPGTGKTKTVLGLLSALLEGAGLSTLRKGTARIRVGASLQSERGGASRASTSSARNSVRVLVAAPSNAAVDELVLRLLSEGLFDGATGKTYKPRIVRVGRPESLQQRALQSERERSESKKSRSKMRKYAKEVEEVLLETQVAKQKNSLGTAKHARQAIVQGAQVVFCTLSGAGSVAMCDFAHEFDALIIDEAAQAVEASTLIPLKFRPHRVILVGDHRQLPATVLSKRLVDVGYDRSLFQRLVENGSPVRMLQTQYRMHPDISRFPSNYFYAGKLVQEPKLKDWRTRPYHAEKYFEPLVFVDVASGTQSQVSGSTSLRNMSEVELIALLVRGVITRFPRVEWNKTIGVIAPYKQQVYELGTELARLEKELDVRLGIEVNTVDGFQGREKDIIIYSCVRTNPGGGGGRRRNKKSQGRASSDGAFWADERRMNVAITRARASLWIIGSSQLLEQSPAWRALLRDARNRGAYRSDADVKRFLTASTR